MHGGHIGSNPRLKLEQEVKRRLVPEDVDALIRNSPCVLPTQASSWCGQTEQHAGTPAIRAGESDMRLMLWSKPATGPRDFFPQPVCQIHPTLGIGIFATPNEAHKKSAPKVIVKVSGLSHDSLGVAVL